MSPESGRHTHRHRLSCMRHPSLLCECPWRSFNEHDIEGWVADPDLRYIFEKSGFPLTRETFIELSNTPGGFHWSSDIEGYIPASKTLVDVLQQISDKRALFIMKEEHGKKYPACPYSQMDKDYFDWLEDTS